MAKLTSKASRIRTHVRIRRKVKGATERPRLVVNFSGQHISAQVIDDVEGKTLVSAFTAEKSLSDSKLRRNPTRARACATLANKSSARKARLPKASKGTVWLN